MLTDKRILALQMTVCIHQIEHLALCHSLLRLRQRHHLAVHIVDKLLANGVLAVSRTHDSIHTPIIKDSGSSVTTAKALFVHSSLAILLSEVNHQRILLQQSRNHQSRHALTAVAGKKVASHALLVVILQEVQHMLADIISLLPSPSNGMGTLLAANHAAHRIIHAHLII